MSEYYEVFLEGKIDESIVNDSAPCIFQSTQFPNSMILAKCSFLENLIQKSIIHELEHNNTFPFANRASRERWMRNSYYIVCYESSFFITKKEIEQIGVASPGDMCIYEVKVEGEIFYYLISKYTDTYIANQYMDCEKKNIKAVEIYNDAVAMVKKIKWRKNRL